MKEAILICSGKARDSIPLIGKLILIYSLESHETQVGRSCIWEGTWGCVVTPNTKLVYLSKSLTASLTQTCIIHQILQSNRKDTGLNNSVALIGHTD